MGITITSKFDNRNNEESCSTSVDNFTCSQISILVELIHQSKFNGGNIEFYLLQMKDDITDYIEENAFETTYIGDKAVEALASISLSETGRTMEKATTQYFESVLENFLDSIPNSADILYVEIKKQDV